MRYPLHIMIEGVDNVGKSTVCRLLSHRLGLLITHMPFGKDYWYEGQMEKAARFYNEILVQFKDTSFIMDRGYVSSLVYSEVFQRQTDLTYILNIEQELRPLVFVLVDPDLQKLVERGDPIIPSSSYVPLQVNYTKLAQARGYFIINVKNKTPEEVVEEICKELK